VADEQSQGPDVRAAWSAEREKPFSSLWKVTRYTRPASASGVGDAVTGFMRQLRIASVVLRRGTSMENAGAKSANYTAPISCLIR
jgi:hypothetical protein